MIWTCFVVAGHGAAMQHQLQLQGEEGERGRGEGVEKVRRGGGNPKGE